MFDSSLERSDRVFIVEDNELMLRIYLSVFEVLGCKASYARSIAEARALLMHRRPDLIVMDDMLPDGSGAELARELRAREEFFRTPILAVASDGGPVAREAMIRAGCSEFLSKPIQMDVFATVARRHLVRAQAAAAQQAAAAWVADPNSPSVVGLDQAINSWVQVGQGGNDNHEIAIWGQRA
jgi:two-component system cell cycle response regulator DivK